MKPTNHFTDAELDDVRQQASQGHPISPYSVLSLIERLEESERISEIRLRRKNVAEKRLHRAKKTARSSVEDLEVSK